MNDSDNTRSSWDIATRNHNAHKGDQAAFLRGGGETLFPEELALLGGLDGKRLVHLQCNAGQDTLSLARRGAAATGVDFSSEAVRFARSLSAETGIAARFIESEIVSWMHGTNERFDLAFSSYGAVVWVADLAAWALGIQRVLAPGGRFIYVEFHPLVWSIGPDLRLSGDDYFATTPFRQPVSDYVLESGPGMLAEARGAVVPNQVPATSWQHTMANVVDALANAGFRLEHLREYPFANGCKVNPALVLSSGRRWCWPDGAARVPLMFGLSACRDWPLLPRAKVFSGGRDQGAFV
jgi:SAM-dependent methyltransferase